MNNNEISKALHGVIRPGGMRHQMYAHGHFGFACSCDDKGHLHADRNLHLNPDYFSKEGFWDALEYAMKQKWWFKFNGEFFLPGYIKVELVDYKTFAKHLHDFLVEEGIIKGDG